MKNRIIPVAIATIAMTTFSNCNQVKKIEHLPYPETERGNVTDNYFGTEVADPYRWLEDDRSEATAAWVKAENEVTFDYLSKIPFRQAIKERLTELWNYPKESAPTKKGDWLYFSRNDGLQNQDIIYRQANPEAEAEVFLDPNQLSDDGTVALASTSFSKDGKYFAFGWLVRILPLSLSRGTAKVCRITGWALFAFLALVLVAELTVTFAVIAPVEGRLSDISRTLELLIYFIQSVLSSQELFVAAGLLLGLGHRHRQSIRRSPC